ncbi:hypothetical protein ABT392_07685 [Paucibacter sp. JuS9]|uniref:hypothetical protein n=1 Tax=Paucibacter sp. JuS9 TaxID=3228748 RepID=UPI003757D9C7
MTQLDQLTQQIAALVVESAAASDSLSRQVDQRAEAARVLRLEPVCKGATQMAVHLVGRAG